jgi:hypothetical protein
MHIEHIPFYLPLNVSFMALPSKPKTGVVEYELFVI